MSEPTTTHNVLSLTGDGYGLTIKRSAIELKQNLIALAEPITAITTTEDLDGARAVVKDLAAFRVQLEKSRKLVKEPVIELGRKIDAAAEQFGADAAAQERRITALGQAFAAEVERQRKEAAEKARREAEAAARAAAEEARKIEAAAAAERARIAAGARAAETAQVDLVRRAQAAEAERVAAQQAAARAQAAAAAATEATKFAAPAVDGVKAELDYEVEDIHALYAAMPSLVDLSPKRRDILATLNRLAAAGAVPQIAGLKVIEKLKLK